MRPHRLPQSSPPLFALAAIRAAGPRTPIVKADGPRAHSQVPQCAAKSISAGFADLFSELAKLESAVWKSVPSVSFVPPSRIQSIEVIRAAQGE